MGAWTIHSGILNASTKCKLLFVAELFTKTFTYSEYTTSKIKERANIRLRSNFTTKTSAFFTDGFGFFWGENHLIACKLTVVIFYNV
jgi:hypothetical protein